MPTIILPVETMAREWDAKLLLAAFLAREGAEVIIGSHARINNRLHALPADVYVSQTIIRAKRRIFRIARDMGLRLAAWDEEGLVWVSPQYYRRRRLDRENWQLLQRFFAWGEEQADVIRQTFPRDHEKLRVTGNPRQDMYSPPMRALHAAAVQRLREELGSFILLNSNFGSLNHSRLPYRGARKTDEELRELARAGGHDVGYLRFRQEVFLSLRELVPRLARAFPERRIVIRPHPSENPAAWQDLANTHANVLVRYDHDLIPWLMAAQVVLHNGCTTAIEAVMLGTPAIEYRQVDNPAWVSRQPRAVSIAAASPEEIVRLLNDPDALRQALQRSQAALHHIIAHMNEGFACQRIARELLDLANAPAPRTSVTRRLLAGIRSRLRGMEKAIIGRVLSDTSASPAYIDKKFPPVDTDSARQTLTHLCGLAKLPVPDMRQLADRIWKITPRRARV